MKIKKKDIALVLILLAAVLIVRPGMMSLVCGSGPAVPYSQMHIIGGLSYYGADWCGGMGSYYPCCNDPSYTVVGNPYQCMKIVTTSMTNQKTLVVPNFTSAIMKYGSLYTFDQLYQPAPNVNLNVMFGSNISLGAVPNHYVDTAGLFQYPYNDCQAVDLVVASNSIDVTDALSPYKGQNISYSVIGSVTSNSFTNHIVDILYNVQFNFTIAPTICQNTCPTGQTQNAYPDCVCHLAPSAPPGFSNIVSQLTTLINQVLTWFRGLFGI